MGVVGLKAAHSTLVIPRMDDCIAMFLGTRAAYRKELNQEPGTYFLSKGWIDAGISLLDELEMMEERYDPDLAERLMKRMLQNYKRLAFIDMGYGDLEKYRQFCQKTAMKFNLNIKKSRGPRHFSRRCVTAHGTTNWLLRLPAMKSVLRILGWLRMKDNRIATDKAKHGTRKKSSLPHRNSSG